MIIFDDITEPKVSLITCLFGLMLNIKRNTIVWKSAIIPIY